MPANSTATLLDFTVEASLGPGDTFVVTTSNPGVAVSLILPSGSEVTASNAASLGFAFTVIPEGTIKGEQIPSIFSLPGTHTLVEMPGGLPAGIYRIKANAASVASDSGITAFHFPLSGDSDSNAQGSGVRTAASTDTAVYKMGEIVVLSGFVFDGATPITGATVTAAVSAARFLSKQMSVTGYQLVSRQPISANLTRYVYYATLTNKGSAAPQVEAILSGMPPGITVLDETLVFQEVAANSSAKSLNTITIQTNTSQPFDPATLQWKILAPGAPVNVTLTDSGTLDAAAGDGIYTGTFTPTASGKYSVMLSITGTSAAGNFTRNAVTEFEVTQPLASFGTFSDSLQADGDLRLVANVNVQTPGVYAFWVELKASNQQTVQTAIKATLAAGPQEIAVTFSKAEMFELGVNGPYERMNARLFYKDGLQEQIADTRPDAGITTAYTLESFRPSVHFTNQNSATGVVTNGGPAFDLLRVQIGVYNDTARSCTISAALTTLTGTRIDYTSVYKPVAAGVTSVSVDFDGYKVGRSGNGPYVVTEAGLSCRKQDEPGWDSTGSSTRFAPWQTLAFTASQFVSGEAGFTLTVGEAPPGDAPGSSFTFPISTSPLLGFEGTISLSATGLPPGTTGAFTSPTFLGRSTGAFIVTTRPETPGGTYPLTITASSGAITRTAKTFLIVLSSLVAKPQLSWTAGTHSAGRILTISTPTPGASIRYTLDNGAPTSSAGTIYRGPFVVSSTRTVRAIAYKDRMTDSAVAESTVPITGVVSISPAAGKRGQTITNVRVAGSGAVWIRGNTTVNFGPGIAVSDVKVTDVADLTAKIAISKNATLGPRSVMVTSQGLEIGKADGFNVISSNSFAVSMVAMTPEVVAPGSRVAIAAAGFAGSFRATDVTVTLTPIGAGEVLTLRAVNIRRAPRSAHVISFVAPRLGAGLSKNFEVTLSGTNRAGESFTSTNSLPLTMRAVQ